MSGAEQSPVYRTMREFASDERPRERLLAHGPSVLSEAELIAIILGSGSAGENVLDLARRITESSGGLAGLVRADVVSLRRIKGLGPAKATQIAAAIELGRRVQAIDPDSRPVIRAPIDVFNVMNPRLAGRTHESFFTLSLDTKQRLLGIHLAFEGGINAVGYRIAEVFREPIILEAHAVVLVHNHPSGDPEPSQPDIKGTHALVEAGDLLGMPIQDHVIIGQNRHVSLASRGQMRAKAAS